MSILSHIAISSVKSLASSLERELNRGMYVSRNFMVVFVFSLLVIFFSSYATFGTNWHKTILECAIESFFIEFIIITLVARIKCIIMIRQSWFLFFLFSSEWRLIKLVRILHLIINIILNRFLNFIYKFLSCRTWWAYTLIMCTVHIWSLLLLPCSTWSILS